MMEDGQHHGDHQHDNEQEEDNDTDGNILFSLTGFGVRDGLETRLAQAAGVSAGQVSIVEEEDDDGDGKVLFVVFGISGMSTEELIERINKHKHNERWICTVAEMEEEIEIDADEAYTIWKSMDDDSRTCHLQLVYNPDGKLIQPKHHHHYNSSGANDECDEQNDDPSSSKPTDIELERQLQRDPQLLEFDNVKRIHISKLLREANTNFWNEPFVITGLDAGDEDDTTTDTDNDDGSKKRGILLSKENLLELIGKDTIVRTGNRNTLIESGFDNSLPMSLDEALLSEERKSKNGSSCRIIFTPLTELPTSFQQSDALKRILSKFPNFSSSRKQQRQHQEGQQQQHKEEEEQEQELEQQQEQEDQREEEQEQEHSNRRHKYTLCVSNSVGFGIGMHKHNEAFFYLLEGCKKWYMSEGTSGKISNPTHPYFYTTKSTHKCIQQSGEILFVPNLWYHEIFNVTEYTAGIQALPSTSTVK